MGNEREEHHFIMAQNKPLSQVKADLVHALLSVRMHFMMFDKESFKQTLFLLYFIFTLMQKSANQICNCYLDRKECSIPIASFYFFWIMFIYVLAKYMYIKFISLCVLSFPTKYLNLTTSLKLCYKAFQDILKTMNYTISQRFTGWSRCMWINTAMIELLMSFVDSGPESQCCLSHFIPRRVSPIRELSCILQKCSIPGGYHAYSWRRGWQCHVLPHLHTDVR